MSTNRLFATGHATFERGTTPESPLISSRCFSSKQVDAQRGLDFATPKPFTRTYTKVYSRNPSTKACCALARSDAPA